MALDEEIGRLSEQVAAASASDDIRLAIAKTRGVPVYQDLGGILLVCPDRRVVQYDTESGELLQIEGNWKKAALVRAGKLFPELQALSPNPPEGSEPCQVCGGSGRVRERMQCGVCFGAGWTSDARTK
jgi:hypothetical protein